MCLSVTILLSGPLDTPENHNVISLRDIVIGTGFATAFTSYYENRDDVTFVGVWRARFVGQIICESVAAPQYLIIMLFCHTF